MADAAAASRNLQNRAEAETKAADAEPVAPKALGSAPTPHTETMETESDAIYLKRMADANDVALNLADASFPADVQAPMQLREAIAFALSNNFEVKASAEKVRGSYWDKMGAYSQYLPSLEASVASGSERSQPAAYNDATGTRVLDSTHHRRDRSIAVRQPLIDLGIIADILSGTDREGVAKSDRRDVREGVAFDTISVFFGLLQSRIAIRLADQYKQYLDDLAARMKVRVDGGGATIADLERVRSRSTLADSARVEAMGEYQTNLSEFKRLTKIMPAQLVIPEVLVSPVPNEVQDAFEHALKSNPSYVSSLGKISLAADDRNKFISGLLPKISAQYTKVFAYDAGGAAKGNPVDGVYPTQTTEAVMLVAQWSLGGTSVTGTLSSMAKTREMNLRAQDVRARIEEGVRAGYTAMNAARERQAILIKAVNANESVVRGFEEQYKSGGRSLFDILDAQEQLYNSRLNLMRVTIAKAKASYQVRRQMGELVQSIMGSESE